MGDATLTPDELNEVNRLIGLFIDGDIADPASARNAVRRTTVLPALEDWSAFGGISRGGEIVWVNREPPFETRTVENARLKRIVLFEASRRYPTLQSLHPKRPPGARDCRDCGGSGRFSLGIDPEKIRIGNSERSGPEMEDAIRCRCGGLGWVIDDEDD